MDSFINDSLAVGLIHPSSSPAGAGFFSVSKDRSLRPCIVYCDFNCITMLQESTIFTKLDLHNTYHLLHTRVEWNTLGATLGALQIPCHVLGPHQCSS